MSGGFIFPPVQTAKIVNSDGTPTSQFVLLFNQLLNRVGGTSGGTYTALSSANSAVTWDFNAAPQAVVVLQNGSNILTILNQIGGAPPYRITIIQPSSGAAGTLVWPSNFLFPGGVAPTLSTGNNAIDMFVFVSDGTNIYLIVEGLNYSI